MIDREKVVKDNAIRGLQSAIEISGALVHLRKEHAIAILELLKEQEAKKVLQIRNVAYRTIGYCPSCGRGLDSYEDGNSGDHITNYCYNCGQAVKWE